MKRTVLFLIVLFLSSPLFAQQYQLKDKYGRNQRVEVRRNCIRQYNRFGRIENSYRVYGNRVYQFNGKGVRR